MKQQARVLLDYVDDALDEGEQYEAMEYLQAAKLLIEGLEHQKIFQQEITAITLKKPAISNNSHRNDENGYQNKEAHRQEAEAVARR
jgi:hypothetical protein